MKNNFTRIMIIIIATILLTGIIPVIGAETETGTWRQLLQVTIPKFNQFTIGGFWNSQNGIAVGNAGVTRYTNDGGKTWQQAQIESSNRYGMDIVNEKIAWSCGQLGCMAKSIDGGVTWQAVSDYGENIPNHCRFISFTDEKTGWVASPTKLGKTMDGGIHWNDMKIPQGCGDLVAIFLRTPEEGYLLDMNGNLFITQNDGEGWTEKTIGMIFQSHKYMPYIAINFSDVQHGEIAIGIGGETQVLSTSDAGATWKKEEISAEIGGYIFLSHDGQFLTVSSMTDPMLTVYQYK
jgi:photosystem II stability/assembly factor-like uncharacterized protein